MTSSGEELSCEELAAKLGALRSALGKHAGRLTDAQYKALIQAKYDSEEALLYATQLHLAEVLRPALGTVDLLLAWQKEQGSLAVPDDLEMFNGLASQTLRRRSLHWDGQDWDFLVLPLGSSVNVGGEQVSEVYMLPHYLHALRALLGEQVVSDLLDEVVEERAAVSPPPDTAQSGSPALRASSSREATPSQGTPSQSTRPSSSAPGRAGKGGAGDTAAAGRGDTPAGASACGSTGSQHGLKRSRASSPGASTPAKRSSGGASPTGSSRRMRRHLVVGIGGVGKSMFLYILAWALLKLGKTVLWHERTEAAVIYVITLGRSMRALTIKQARKWLICKDNWYLCDAITPEHGYVTAESVIAASPKAAATSNDFIKISRELWFPPWPLRDLLCANTVLPPLLSQDAAAVVEAFSVFGGAARSVFMSAADPRLKTKLDALIDSMDVTQLLQAMAASYPRDDMSSKVFHVQTQDEDPLERKGITFGSDYIAKRALQALVKRGYDEVKRFMLECAQHGMLAAARGYMLENFVDKELASGGTITVVHLDTDLPAN